MKRAPLVERMELNKILTMVILADFVLVLLRLPMRLPLTVKQICLGLSFFGGLRVLPLGVENSL